MEHDAGGGAEARVEEIMGLRGSFACSEQVEMSIWMFL